MVSVFQGQLIERFVKQANECPVIHFVQTAPGNNNNIDYAKCLTPVAKYFTTQPFDTVSFDSITNFLFGYHQTESCAVCETTPAQNQEASRRNPVFSKIKNSAEITGLQKSLC